MRGEAGDDDRAGKGGNQKSQGIILIPWLASLSKNYTNAPVYGKIGTRNGGVFDGKLEEGFTERSSHNGFGGIGAERPSASKNRESDGLRMVI